MSRDEFFQNLFNDSTPAAEDIKVLRQLAYEERVIKRIFTECGLRPSSWGRLAVDCREKTQATKLNFAWFNATYSEFPGQLIGRRVPFLHKTTLIDLFKPPAKNRLVRAISRELTISNVNPKTQSYMFVFPIVKTSFCAHSLGSLADTKLAAAYRQQFVMLPPDSDRPFIVEPLKNICTAIGLTWFTM
jgi:hypothetical protein